ncbi:MAG: type II toxin-antitoxin system Phd/YefM family antitoxin [Parasynechococcus sp.]|uniref:type II toxin-antitoxin system Phd/YefM family antitoxin n=1 Tax=Parasynechococcus sp. TaxID=3101203 RepID=UPI003889F98A
MNLHDAKTLLSRYVEQALDGDEVVPVSTTPRRRQLGFMRTKGIATADLKGDFADDINTMFGC